MDCSAEQGSSVSGSAPSEEAGVWACKEAQQALASLRSRIEQNDDLLCGVQSSLADALAGCHTSNAVESSIGPEHAALRVTERETGSRSHRESTTGSGVGAEEPFRMDSSPPSAALRSPSTQLQPHPDKQRTAEPSMLCIARAAPPQAAEVGQLNAVSAPQQQELISPVLRDGLTYDAALPRDGAHGAEQRAAPEAQSWDSSPMIHPEGFADGAFADGVASARSQLAASSPGAAACLLQQFCVQDVEHAAVCSSLPLAGSEPNSRSVEASVGTDNGAEEAWVASQRARTAHAAEWRRQQDAEAHRREEACRCAASQTPRECIDGPLQISLWSCLYCGLSAMTAADCCTPTCAPAYVVHTNPDRGAMCHICSSDALAPVQGGGCSHSTRRGGCRRSAGGCNS